MDKDLSIAYNQHTDKDAEEKGMLFMNIIVCVKQTPEAGRGEMDPKTTAVRRTDGRQMINPFDLYAMEAGASYIRSGRYKRIIICGGDHMSSMTNYEDRNTCPIFGDGAACVMMEATTEKLGLMDGYYRVDGKGYQNLHMAAGGSAKMPSHETVDAREHFVYQEGRAVYKHAVLDMSSAVKTLTERNGLNKDNIAWVIPHQANINIEVSVAKRIGVDEDHVMVNIDHMANTSGGTLPLCLWEYEPRLKKGDKLVFTAFGAGFTWGASYMIWGYDGAAEAAKEPAEFYKEGEITREEWYAKRK